MVEGEPLKRYLSREPSHGVNFGFFEDVTLKHILSLSPTCSLLFSSDNKLLEVYYANKVL